ncbi:MAG: PDZ domain-containing protein [Burkholderiaceae bacterium]
MISYSIGVEDPHAHLFRVTLNVPRPAARQRLSLPVWIPGSYLVREFSRHLSALDARQGRGNVELEQIDKASWVAHCEGRGALTLSYSVYAFDASVRAAYLDAHRGFFNGTSVFLRAEGFEAEPQRLVLRKLPRGWQVATTLSCVSADAAGRGTYHAADYDELVDHPVELGKFWRGRFKACGTPHEVVITGALPDFDADRLLADMRSVCEREIEFWHPASEAAAGARRNRARAVPFKRYLFLLNAIDEGHGGLEHRCSTALIASRRQLPQRQQTPSSDGYVRLLGLVAHEYFHSWNVKRMRPAEFTTFDYARENYTELLWFFEGFTSYYDDLTLVRAGLIDASRYLALLAKTLSGVLGTPGRTVQSVAQASFDAWVKYYRADENTPNATISYYAKGSLVALALDLTLRAKGHGSLDDVMRQLWQMSHGGPISRHHIAKALRAVGRRSFENELTAWVDGVGELPLRSLLRAFGVDWQVQPATMAQRLGVRVSESALTGIKVTHVLRGGAAQAAGLAAGDEILALGPWRLRRLDDAERLLEAGRVAPLLVARDQRIVTLELTRPVDENKPSDAMGAPVILSMAAKAPRAALALRQAWLAG